MGRRAMVIGGLWASNRVFVFYASPYRPITASFSFSSLSPLAFLPLPNVLTWSVRMSCSFSRKACSDVRDDFSVCVCYSSFSAFYFSCLPWDGLIVAVVSSLPLISAPLALDCFMKNPFFSYPLAALPHSGSYPSITNSCSWLAGARSRRELLRFDRSASSSYC